LNIDKDSFKRIRERKNDMESFDFKGFWWLPNNSSERLAGICRFTSFEGGELEIIGNSDYLIEFNIVNQPFIILGTTVKNGDITLYDCFLRKKEKGNGVFLYYVYVNLIFLGHHFYNDSNVKFNQISIHYSFINEWVNNQILDFVQSENAEEHIVNKGGEQLAQASIDNNYSLSININYGKSVSLFEKITIDRKVFITIDSSQERHYKDYIKIMSYTRNFLTLAITKPVFPLIMNGFISQDGVISVVRILGKLSSPANDILASKLSWHEMFFTFHDISDKFELFIKNWFDKAKDMATIYQLYCGVLENPNSYYPQQEFLSLIQSLESYCQKDINPELKTERINNPNFNRNLNLKIMSLFKSKTYVGFTLVMEDQGPVL
ncbi:MAG: hypothetical protein ACKPKS_13095, partial [Dolichospermum sp.]